MLDLKHDRLSEPLGHRDGIDSTDQVSTLRKLKLSCYNGLDSNVTGLRGGTLRHLNPETVLLPVQQLRELSTDLKQLLTYNMYSSKMS